MDHLTVSPTQLAVAAGLLIVLVVLVLLIVLIARGRRRRRRKRAEATSAPLASPPTEPTPMAISMPERPGPAAVDRAPVQQAAYWSSAPPQRRSAAEPRFEPTEPDRTADPAPAAVAAEPVDSNSAAPAPQPGRNGIASAANPPADQDHGYRAAGPTSAAPTMDAKDRLLRVLLADPVRALHAVGDLEASRGQLDRLNESVRYQRRQLADAARRLRGAGLTPAQVAQLAGFGEGELVTLLAEHAPSPTPRQPTRAPETH
ncbi:MAG TPA: hypothetical protein VK735_20210 [Pseudonocardia sp.]|uniref:hypothetical protein n=1 Tax=Pseudonocardia sp. TaxID=60912 RepID=UPI002C37F855|nr:hypothetical protein [Pseudonocardia sp.]HTF49772.1 hypothetical protein [Pseudonocardia sp.]